MWVAMALLCAAWVVGYTLSVWLFLYSERARRRLFFSSNEDNLVAFLIMSMFGWPVLLPVCVGAVLDDREGR